MALRRERLCLSAVALLLLTACIAPLALAQDEADPPKEPPTVKEPVELPTPKTGPANRTGEYAEQDHFWFNDQDGKSQWEDPSPTLVDEEGNEYFVDAATNETTWDQPQEAAWVALYDEKHEQHYYFNEVTNETTWEVPYLFAWRKVYVNEANEVVDPPEEDWATDEEWQQGGDEEHPESESADAEEGEELTPEELAELEALYAEEGGDEGEDGEEESEDSEHQEL